MMGWGNGRRVILKDSTLREGLDVPGVTLDPGQKRALLVKLAELQVPEAEVVAPGHFDTDIKVLQELGMADLPIASSGLIYGNGPECLRQIAAAGNALDRVDILMPAVAARPPAGLKEKAVLLREAVQAAAGQVARVGAGFPHSLQVGREALVELCLEAVSAGATRITLYDTNGAADPWEVGEIVGAVRQASDVEICFHAHNDLGMATANSLSAVRAGATCLDVTINGLGDRAGNASLEQVAVALHNRGADHGLRLELLPGLSRWVAEATGVPLSQLAPVVGEFIFCHKSPSHLVSPRLFEAFDPALIGMESTISKS